MLTLFDLSQREGRDGLALLLEKLQASSSIDGKWWWAASELIAETRQRGDDAIVDHMRRFTDAAFEAHRIRVTADELAAAEAALDPGLRAAITRAIVNVREYQEHLKPRDPGDIEIAGATLGLRWTPIQPVGLLVPGGSAVLFSTLIMLAVPAIVAGVDPAKIAVVSPPPYRKDGELPGAGDISPITLAVAAMLGIGRVYRIGGPPAVAALAYGTQTVDPVSFIAGPGHPIVQAAKLQLRGRVGTDDFYGASEIAILVDGSVDPDRIAADLLAQAEHDPGKCFLVGWSRRAIDAVQRSVEVQLPRRARRAAIIKALREESCAVLAADEAAACAVIDRLAAEHVTLAVRDPRAAMERIRHGGEFFLGDTPNAAGDYYAGPSHTLPTGTTARFSSGVSVYTFLKRSGTVAYPHGMPPEVIDDIARMAQAEGLEAHAASVTARRTPDLSSPPRAT